MNERSGLNFDIYTSIKSQVNFFACPNNLLDQKLQDDIAKYVYCKNTKTSPYRGAYGDTPSLWIQKFFVIKSAMHQLEKIQQNKMKKEREKVKKHGR
tara:strand:- start:519 stop:809 length:291 start_codon:yes stop_codon:yes gene_type:complete